MLLRWSTSAFTALTILPLLVAGAAARQPRASAPPVLVVLPLNIASSGRQGGPFSPSSFQYRIRTTTGTIGYLVAAPFWLTVDSRAGVLDTEGLIVTLKINSLAKRLQPGAYTQAVRFTNATNGRGSGSRVVRLVVAPPDPTRTAGIERRSPLSDELTYGPAL